MTAAEAVNKLSEGTGAGARTLSLLLLAFIDQRGLTKEFYDYAKLCLRARDEENPDSETK